jgi:hypothetical protein
VKPHLNNVVLDTNLLLLWLVARTDATLLLQFKRVKQFTYRDFELLQELLQPYRKFVTTPHILSETSNFLDQAPFWQRDALIDALKDFIRSGVEVYRPADELIERDEFNALGLTDTAIAQLSAEAVVLTVDFRLAGKIEALGGNALNFNDYRTGLTSPLSPCAPAHSAYFAEWAGIHPPQKPQQTRVSRPSCP